MYGRSRSTYRRYFCSALLALACAFPLVASGVQAQDVLTFTAVSHNFGSTAVNTTVNFGMKVTNSSASTPYLNFQVNLSGSAAFAQYNNCPASLAPTKSCEVIFTFTPTALGTVSATWNLTGTGDPTFSYSPALPGTLTGKAIAAGVTLSTGGHNFGTEFTGYFTQPYGVVLTNATTNPVALLIGNGNAYFKISQSTSNCGMTLAANQSCNIQWEFAPNGGFHGAASQPTAYTYLNPITVTDKTTGQPVILTAPGYGNSLTPVQVTGATLTGYGISGPSNYVGVSTSSHDFGEWAKGTESGLYGIQLINTESGPVQLTYTMGAGFSNFQAPGTLNNCFTSGTTAYLAGGQSCQVQFAFLPNNQTYGALSTTFGLTATYQGNSINVEDLSQGGVVVSGVTLSGTQVAGYLNLSTASHNFGAWINGITSTVFPNQLTNTQCAAPASPQCPVPGNGIVITLSPAAGYLNFPRSFARSPYCTTGETLAPTASCYIDWTFDPASGTLGALSEAYGISAKDAVTGEVIQLTSGGAVVPGVALSGYSTNIAGALLPTASFTFSEQGIGGTSGPYTTTLYNTNGSAVTVAYAYDNPSMGSNFTLATPVCSVGSTKNLIANHGYCTFSWTFTPNEVGPITATYDMTVTSGGSPVTLTNVASGQPVSGVTLQGTGVN